ncbi:MAG: EF-Tu/IF-2/RF-3 family GTPase [Candidatus Omnitrophota bacterium]
MEEKKIGVVTHYFGHLGVGIIKIEEGSLKVGETIHFKGHTTDFQQTILSLQMEHQNVQQVKPGDLVGIKVEKPVHEHDQVFKV